MKTTNVIILVGVLGVGGVGAYMYMKNKQAQNALLTGSLPATNQGGATTPSGTTTPTGGATTTTPTGGATTTPTLATQSDGVSPSDANVNLANATILVAEISAIDKEYATPFRGETKIIGCIGYAICETPEYKAYNRMRATYKIRREPKVTALAKLGYKVDATGSLVRI
jgi:hypothetical protein